MRPAFCRQLRPDHLGVAAADGATVTGVEGQLGVRLAEHVLAAGDPTRLHGVLAVFAILKLSSKVENPPTATGNGLEGRGALAQLHLSPWKSSGCCSMASKVMAAYRVAP